MIWTTKNNSSSLNNTQKGHEMLVSRLYDALKASHTRSEPILTSFLSLPEQEVAKTLLSNKTEFELWGGYAQAERKQAILNGGTQDSDIVCLVSPLYEPVSHPQVLGALMHMGIDRGQIGDIRMEEDTLSLFCRKALAPFICAELTRAGKASLHLRVEEHTDLQASETETVTVICASLRLDAVIASLAHCSRSQAAEKIRAGDIKVNDVPVVRNGTLCNNDFVSIRRCGRFRFVKKTAETRKGRMVLAFEKSI